MTRDANDIAREYGAEGLRKVWDLADIGSSRTRIKLVKFEDIKFGADRRYLVKGLIPYPGLAVIWGPPKCGKSFWTFDVAIHAALGWDYRDRRIHQGPVVYCAFEGQAGMGARSEAFRQRHLAGHTEPVPFYLVAVTLDLVGDHEELIVAIRTALADTEPVAVVLDTLNRSLRGSESSDQDMTAYIQAADAIREAFQCAVLVVHHCGVDGTRPRGHTSLTGAADAQLAVKRDGAGNVVATVEYMKDGPEGEMITSRLEVVDLGTDQDGDPATSCVVVEAEAVAAAGTAVRGQAGVALKALQQAIQDAGEEPPPCEHIPSGTMAVSESLWRKYAYQIGITESDKPDTKDKAFKRSASTLINRNIVRKWGDWVWIV